VAEKRLVYLDASAFVKLVVAEPETAALVAALTPDTTMVASEILEVEALRATRRASGEDAIAATKEQLEGVRLLALNQKIRKRAGELEPATLRTLDAIHIASALDLGGRLDCVYAYDTRLTLAAEQAGLEVRSPQSKPPEDEGEDSDDDVAATPTA
jgi:uncharacterized protein